MHVYSDNNLLIADIRNGKHEAYEYLFATYYPRLHNYALRFLADGDAVGDIIQDCFMKLWEKRGELILQSVGALLFRMVRNQWPQLPAPQGLGGQRMAAKPQPRRPFRTALQHRFSGRPRPGTALPGAETTGGTFSTPCRSGRARYSR